MRFAYRPVRGSASARILLDRDNGSPRRTHVTEYRFSVSVAEARWNGARGRGFGFRATLERSMVKGQNASRIG
jgi:hypothetical protein